MGSTLSSTNIFHKLRLCLFSDQKFKFLPQTLVKFQARGAVYQMACVPKMKGLIVVIAEYFCSLLTLHSLDSHFENRLLLSQQPFHHGAKLP